jgi:hypothetical protein
LRVCASWLQPRLTILTNSIVSGNPADHCARDTALGPGIVGHRRKLHDAIAALRTNTTAPRPSGDLKTAPAAQSAFPEDGAERRQVTVLFSDFRLNGPVGAHGP